MASASAKPGAKPARPAPRAATAKAPAKKDRLFYSPDGTDIRVTHDDGAVALVGDVPRPLPPKLWKAALKAGCYSTDTVPRAELDAASEQPGLADAFTRRAAIKQAMEDAMDAEENAAGFENAFTDHGIPNLRWIEKRVGFGIDAAERDEVWGEVERELEAADDGDADDDSTE